MRCPKCGAITEVSEKRGPYRERRCLNRACRFDFTTCENFVTQEEGHRVRAKALATRLAALNSAPAECEKAASAS
ncbi:MAG: hypothetical protein ABSA41_01860 [Terriglobia bacterium]|jgi:hypothetical protein